MLIKLLNGLISKLSKTIPLRTVIIVPFVIQIFAAVGLTGWLSFRNGQKAVDDLATQLRSEVSTRIYQHLMTHTTMPHRANQINVNAINLKLLNLEDTRALERHLWKQIQYFETVSYMGIGTQKGNYVGAQLTDTGSTLVEIWDQTTHDHLQIWETDAHTNRTALKTLLSNYEPRTRPWYVTATKAGKPVWSEPYFSSRRATLSANQPIYDSQGNLLAVATADISLEGMGQFLSSLKIGQTGQSFIMERSGLMVTTSTSEKPYHLATVVKSSKIDSNTSVHLTPVERYKAVNSHNTLTRAAANYLIQHIGDLNHIKNRQNLEFISDGKRYFLQVMPFQDKWGLDWLIVVMVPEADFMKHIEANMYYTIVLSLVALMVTILVGIITAQWIIQPLLRLNLAAKALAKGEWQQLAEVERHDEVGELANSFGRMAKQLQELFSALEAKNTDLQRLDKLKDDFLANTSHELRTPLNGIIGIAESLIDGVTGSLPPETSSNLELIVANGQRLSNLVNDILDFSKQKHKPIELQWGTINLRNLVEVVLKFCQPLVGKKNLQLINAIPPDFPLANADENRVQQILHNLIGNAIKFTEKGHVKISSTKIKEENQSKIGTERKTEPSQFWEHLQLAITVSDTGIGIPADKKSQLFKSFEQLDSQSSVNHFQGTGLGLAITKQLVALHGGKIWVESTVNLGSRFTFTLPTFVLEKPTSTPASINKTSSIFDNAQAKTSVISGIPQSPKIDVLADIPGEADVLKGTSILKNLTTPSIDEKKSFTILIVDDEPVNLQVLTNHLSLYNYVIIQASSGFEALATLEKGVKPDLILLDVMMPHMTGYEVTQKIRESWEASELPILLLTAKNQVADLVTGLELGANDYLVKPISKSELLARIKTHLHIKELKAETLRLAIESERRLTQFLEAVPVGVFVTDTHGRPYYANQRAQELLGKGVIPETTVKTLNSVYQMYVAGTSQLYPNDRILALQGQKQTVNDIEIHRPDKIVPLEAWGTPIFDEKGNTAYTIVAFQDITERKQAEAEREQFTNQLFHLNKELEEYSRTLEQKVEERTRKLKESEAILEDAQRMALLGSWVWDIKTGTVIRSAQDCRNFKLEPKNYTPTYQSFIEQIHPKDKDIIGSMVEKCIIEGKTAEFEFRVVWPDGQIRTMSSQTELELDASGTPIRMKGFSHDITERKEAEAKLQEAKQAAEKALQQLQATQQQLVESEKMAALGNLVAGVAHEINTPIGIGVTATSRLETLSKELTLLYENGKMKRADLEKYLKSILQGNELILKNLTRAAELIQSFKQVAVDQSSERKRTFILKEYLHEILISLRPKFKRTKHQVSIECEEKITLSSYPGIFSQILTNLIMNSLIHGFKDHLEGHITITATQENDNLILRYSDDGQGIPKNIINNIFEPFFTTNRQGGGSGLGLHIVYNLVTHNLNGTIHCESVEDFGTTFILEIPPNHLESI